MNQTIELKKQRKKKERVVKKVSIRRNLLAADSEGNIILTYEVFGCPLHTAPLILVNHALTGNSRVSGERGWWNRLIGEGRTLDTDRYTVLAFNIPGNGFSENEDWVFKNYESLTTRKIAELFWRALDALKVKKLFAVIGGSLGGAISWEMAFLRPKRISHLIPVAVSLRASDWLIAQVLIQESILKNSIHPVSDARRHAMTLYRTPGSFRQRFSRNFDETENRYAVEDWLDYHGETLEKRFDVKSYLLMNHLLKTIGSDLELIDILRFSQSKNTAVHIIGIDSDLLFVKSELLQGYRLLKRYHENTGYSEIKSIHGHDAFLIEYAQLEELLNPIFKNKNK